MNFDEAMELLKQKRPGNYRFYTVYDNKYWFCLGDPTYWVCVDPVNGEIIDYNSLNYLYDNNAENIFDPNYKVPKEREDYVEGFHKAINQAKELKEA